MPRAIPRTRTELVATLAAAGLRLRKRHGQSLLVDPQMAEAIVADAGVTREDAVVEVGPGAGALTAPLLAHAGKVTAVELDRGLHALLAGWLGDDPRLRLVHGDALDGGLHPALREALAEPGFRRHLVVSNLPYTAGTEVVVRLLALPAPPDELVLMLQEEVVDRMRAAPGTKDYGPLAVLVALTAGLRVLRRVPPAVFLPRPAVDSVVFRLTPDPARRPAGVDLAAVSALAQRAFLHRRKTLQNALREVAPPEALRAAGLDPAARPETVAPEGWVRLARELA